MVLDCQRTLRNGILLRSHYKDTTFPLLSPNISLPFPTFSSLSVRILIASANSLILSPDTLIPSASTIRIFFIKGKVWELYS